MYEKQGKTGKSFHSRIRRSLDPSHAILEQDVQTIPHLTHRLGYIAWYGLVSLRTVAPFDRRHCVSGFATGVSEGANAGLAVGERFLVKCV